MRQNLRATRLIVEKNGTVLHWPQFHPKTACANVDLSDWPAESVTCQVMLAGVSLVGQDHVHFIHPYRDQVLVS
jgi:hypothetical protein